MIVANKNVDIVNLHPELVDLIKDIEEYLGEDLIVTSGFRDADHPIEAAKRKPGVHYGDGKVSYAVDIACVGGTNTLNIVQTALDFGCKRIGINRKSNFVHLDIADQFGKVKSIWTY